MDSETQNQPETVRVLDKFAAGVFIANGVFLAVGAVILLFFAEKLFGNALGLPAAAGFLWQLLGICALALAVLAIGAAGTRHHDFYLFTMITLLIFQVGAAVISFVTGLTTSHAVFANFVPHLIFAILLSIAWWRMRRRWMADARKA